MNANSPSQELQALFERLEDGPLTIWATLKEDGYETAFGDGYYAYVDQLFPTPAEAARAVEETGPEAMTKLHIRRYDLKRIGDHIQIIPAPSGSEPTTVEIIAAKLGGGGFQRF